MNIIAEDRRGTPAGLLLSIMLVSSCLLLYIPSVSYFFAQDDFLFLLRASHFSLDGLAKYFNPPGPFFRPLSTSLYFATMLKLFGLKPSAYHVFSIVVFSSNVVLAYHVGFAIFKNRETGFALAVFYLTRGILFETVSWASGVQDLLMTFFVLWSLLAFFRYGQGRKHWLILSMGAFAAALLSKETAVVFPLFILAIGTLWGKHDVRFRHPMAVAPFFILSAVFILVRSLLVLPMPRAGEYATGIGLFWLANLARYFLACFNMLLIPTPSFSSNPLSLLFVFMITVAILLIPLLVGRVQRQVGDARTAPETGSGSSGDLRPVAFGLIVFVFGIMPALQFKNRFEPYYASLACLGVAIILTAILHSFSKRRIRAAILVGVFVISMVTIAQLRARQLSHVGKFSPVAEKAIADLSPALEDIPPSTTIRILNPDPYLVSALYSEKAIKVFFPSVESVIFDDGKSDYESKGDEIVFDNSDGNLRAVRQ
jgi:hypothetical protein